MPRGGTRGVSKPSPALETKSNASPPLKTKSTSTQNPIRSTSRIISATLPIIVAASFVLLLLTSWHVLAKNKHNVRERYAQNMRKVIDHERQIIHRKRQKARHRRRRQREVEILYHVNIFVLAFVDLSSAGNFASEIFAPAAMLQAIVDITAHTRSKLCAHRIVNQTHISSSETTPGSRWF